MLVHGRALQSHTSWHLPPWCCVKRRVWLAGPLAGLRTFLQSRQEIYAIAPIGVGQRKLKVI